MDFTEEQLLRYSRQLILKQIGGNGQEKLFNARVLIIGAGGLGSPAAFYLAAAGIGTIGLVDSDKVDLSNLHRQILHFTKDVGTLKIDSAREKLSLLNPDVKINTYHTRVDSKNIKELIKDYDFIIDGSDNFPTKFLINDACVMMQKPFSFAGVLRFEGQTLTYLPGHTCYRCVFIEPPPAGVVPSCREAGVLGAVPGIIGAIQATEAMKYILGAGNLLTDVLLLFDALEMNFSKLKLNRNENCPVCGKNPVITELKDYEQQICNLRTETDINV